MGSRMMGTCSPFWISAKISDGSWLGEGSSREPNKCSLMNVETSIDTGLEVIDLRYDDAFAARRLHIRDVAMQMEGMQRLARAFVESPDTILQELVNAAVDLCGADSAGISIEQENGSDDNFYQWVATAGEYAGFLNATLPRYPSACGMCLERGPLERGGLW